MELAKAKPELGGIEPENPAQLRRMVLLLAWPAIAENFLATLVQFVDTAMVGGLGAVAIAATGLSNSPIMLLNGLFAALSVGSTALVARFTGARDKESANKVAQQSLLVGIVLALLLTVLMLLFAHLIPIAMGAEPDVVPVAATYLRILSVTFVLSFSAFILNGILRGAGDTKTPMQVNILANIINVIGNFLLIYPTREILINLPGFGETALTIPGAGLGVTGAAIATAFSRGVAGLIVLYILFAGQHGVRIVFSLKPDFDVIRRIIKIGLPASGERLTMSGGQMVFGSIVLGLGTTQYAAHHLAIVAESISYMPGFGFSMAATTLVGQALGAGNSRLAERSGYATWKLGATVMVAMGAVFLAIPEYLIMLFNRDQEIVSFGAMCLRMVALGQLPLSSSAIMTGALRGAGDTLPPLLIAALGMWGVRLTLAWFLVNRLGMGLMGAWTAMVIDLWLRGTITFLRFRSGRWKSIKV